MKKSILTLSLLLFTLFAFSQFRLGIFAGVSNYRGDLSDGLYQNSRAAFGITGTFSLSQRFSIRTGLTFAKVAGADSLSSKEELRARNLSFQSRITELSVLGEYNLFNLGTLRWTPYIFGGVSLFRFNPYTYDQNGIQVFLQPLSTEGQGIDGYLGQPYALTQFAIPFGGGIKYAISDRVHLGLEVGLRKLFTDYLDDVSTTYADPSDLRTARGDRAVELSYRGGELPGGTPYPEKGMMRGSTASKDYYYFTGLHLTFQLSEGKDRSGIGCPKIF